MIRDYLAALSLLLVMPLSACRKGDDTLGTDVSPAKSATPATSSANDDGPAPTSTSTPVSHAKVNAVEKVAATVGLADGLPDLKPVIEKPFPEGATEEQVCEAIDNTSEKDLWVRFGHIIPMHVFGSIFVLDAGTAEATTVVDFLAKDYGGYSGRIRVCKNKESLLYIRGFTNNHEEYGRIVGREHLVATLKEKLQLQTRESFTFDDDQERLSDYCRADAELCEQLVKLDFANEGVGLCNFAISHTGADANDEQHLSACLALSPEKKACAYVSWKPSESEKEEDCVCGLRSAFALPIGSECGPR